MTYTSCISHPPRSQYIQVHAWQVKFCQGHHCAALLLAFFIAWHDWKIKHDQHYRKTNDIAEMHGDGRPHGEDAYLFFTNEELQEGCLHFYGKKTINEALELLVSLEAISVHQNPNPRYHFDKTKYFKFYPAVCNHWIANVYSTNDQKSTNDTQVVDSSDRAKMPHASGKNARTSGKKERPSGKSSRAITDTTNNTTNKDHSLRAPECELIQSISLQASAEDTHVVVEALVAKGMSAKRFYPDSIALIAALMQSGATAELFCKAYDKAVDSTSDGNFGIKYLATIIADRLAPSKQVSTYPNKAPPVPKYEHDFRHGLDWMGDLA